MPSAIHVLAAQRPSAQADPARAAATTVWSVFWCLCLSAAVLILLLVQADNPAVYHWCPSGIELSRQMAYIPMLTLNLPVGLHTTAPCCC